MILLLRPAGEPFSQEQRRSLPAALLPGQISQEPEAAATNRQNLTERSRSWPKRAFRVVRTCNGHSHYPAETNHRGNSDRATKGAPSSCCGRAGVNSERRGRERSSPVPLSSPLAGDGATLQHPGQSPQDATPAPCRRAGPLAARAWPGTGAFSRAVGGSETSQAVLRFRSRPQPPPSPSPPAGKSRGRRK